MTFGMHMPDHARTALRGAALRLVSCAVLLGLGGCRDDAEPGPSASSFPPATLDPDDPDQLESLTGASAPQVFNLGYTGVALACLEGVHDVIGRIGEQQVWGMAPTRTRDATLRRKCAVTAGDLDGADAFDPALEWDGFAVDTFDDLGQRTCP